MNFGVQTINLSFYHPITFPSDEEEKGGRTGLNASMIGLVITGPNS